MTSSIYLDNLFRPFLWFIILTFFSLCNARLLLYSAFFYSSLPYLFHFLIPILDMFYPLLPPPPLSCVPSAESVLCSLTDDLL